MTDKINPMSDDAPLLIDDLTEAAAHTATALLAMVKKQSPSTLKANQKQRQQFEKRLVAHWQEPLDLLEMFVGMSWECAAEFRDAVGNETMDQNAAVLEVLIGLHAKACRTSTAILALLRSGHADQAEVLWRSLHESAVVSGFIRQEGKEIAERYLEHDTIQRYKSAKEQCEHAARLGQEPLLQKELDELESQCNNLVAQYGKPFKLDYGWAASASALNKSIRPSLKNMERAIGLDHWRPYYRMASDMVHPNAHGVLFTAGLRTQGEMLLVGPSNWGLAEPGHSAAISLGQVTIGLITYLPSPERLTHAQIFLNLMNEIGEAFLNAPNELERLSQADI